MALVETILLCVFLNVVLMALIFNAFQILFLVYLKIQVFLNFLCGRMSKGQISKAKRLSSLFIINGILFQVFGVHR